MNYMYVYSFVLIGLLGKIAYNLSSKLMPPATKEVRTKKILMTYCKWPYLLHRLNSWVQFGLISSWFPCQEIFDRITCTESTCTQLHVFGFSHKKRFNLVISECQFCRMMELQCTCMIQCSEFTAFNCIHLKKTTENYLKFTVYMHFPLVRKIIAQCIFLFLELSGSCQLLLNTTSKHTSLNLFMTS